MSQYEDIKKDLMERWKKNANNLVVELEKWPERDILLYSNIIEVPERERDTAMTLLNIKLSEKQELLLNDLKRAVVRFNTCSTRISIAMYVLALATFVATIRIWLGF